MCVFERLQWCAISIWERKGRSKSESKYCTFQWVNQWPGAIGHGLSWESIHMEQQPTNECPSARAAWSNLRNSDWLMEYPKSYVYHKTIFPMTIVQFVLLSIERKKIAKDISNSSKCGQNIRHLISKSRECDRTKEKEKNNWFTLQYNLDKCWTRLLWWSTTNF